MQTQPFTQTTPFKITATEAAAIKAALKKKQVVTKTGEKIGQSPEEAINQVYQTLGARYGVKWQTIAHYFKTEDGEIPYNYITGEPVALFAPEAVTPSDGPPMPGPEDMPEHIPGTPLSFSPDLPGGPEDQPTSFEQNGIIPEKHLETERYGTPAEQADYARQHDDFEYMDEQAVNLPFVLTPEEKPWLAKFMKMELEVVNILALCKAQVVEDPATRDQATGMVTNATKLAKQVDARIKELVAPLKDDIAVITGVGKKLFTPLDDAARDLKKKITDFNLQAEKDRQAALAKAAEDKRKQEELALQETLRVNKLKEAREKFVNTMDQEINVIQNIAQLEAYLTKMKAWNPKPEYWQELHGDIIKERDLCITRAEGRRSICLQLEEQERKNVEAQQQGKAAADKAAKDQRALQDKLAMQKLKDDQARQKRDQEKEALETNAKFTVTTALQQLGWVKDALAEEIEQVFSLFGSYSQAAAQFEKMVSGSSTRLSAHNERLTLEAGKAKNMRTVWKVRITDPNKIPRDYMVVDMTKINNLLTSFKEEIVAGTFKVEGVEFYPETSAVAAKATAQS